MVWTSVYDIIQLINVQSKLMLACEINSANEMTLREPTYSGALKAATVGKVWWLSWY